MTVSEYLTAYTSARADQRAQRTIEAEKRYIRLYIGPVIGHIPTWRLSSKQVSAMLVAIADTGHTRTAEAVYIYLQSACANNQRLSRIMAGVKRPIHKSKHITYWSSAQAAHLIAHCNPSWRPVWAMILAYGLRRGEIAGLRWSDIDDAAGIIHIRNQRQYVQGKGLIDSTPKSDAGMRDLPLLPEICAMLDSRALMHDIGADPSPYVFGGISPSSINHALSRDCKLLGLPPITVHGLRHTMAALAMTQHQSIRVLQSVLGHASVSTTARVYAHVDLDPQRDLCSAVSTSWLY